MRRKHRLALGIDPPAPRSSLVHDVEELDVVKHIAPGFFAGLVFLATDTFAFEQVEEALRDGSCSGPDCAAQGAPATRS